MLEQVFKRKCEEQGYQDLYSRYYVVKMDLVEKIKVIPMFFPHFSRHDASHSENLIESAGRLIGTENIEALSLSDSLFLLLSAYVHDSGMSITYKEIEDLVNSDEWQKQLTKISNGKQVDIRNVSDVLLNYPDSVKNDKREDSIEIYRAYQDIIEAIFRKQHAERSAEFIKASEDIIKLLKIRHTMLLADICEAHGNDVKDIMNLPFEENGLFSDYLHPRFIAAMLCFCDLLDMDTDRFDETILQSVSELPQLSKSHKKKHESLRHFLIKKGSVEIKSDCDYNEVYRVMREWMDWMDTASRFLSYNWDEICSYQDISAPRIKQCEILLNGSTKWREYVDTKITIDSERALDIFSGSNVYRNKSAFFNEILQNSIDATLIQFCRDIKDDIGKSAIDELTEDEALSYIRNTYTNNQTCWNSEDLQNYYKVSSDWSVDKDPLKNYVITGNFSIEDSRVKIEIIDRGTGISDDEIKNIAGLKGKTDIKKEEIKTLPEFLKPSGSFSLGLQTVFQVAKRVEFYTKADDEKAKHIIFETPKSGNGYVTVEDYSGKLHRGTKTVIYLAAELFEQSDFNIGDFIYQTKPKENLILQWLNLHCNNDEDQFGEHVPNYRYQTSDYFPIDIKSCFAENQENELHFRRKSCLCDLAEVKPLIRIVGHECYFHHVNLKKGIVFDGIVRLPGTKENKFDGKLGYSLSNKYGQSVWYRNVFVRSSIDFDRLNPADKLLAILDFRVNLISDSADDILTIGRGTIRDKYKEKLDELLLIESDEMRHAIIDYTLDEGTDLLALSSILFSMTDGYRSDEIKGKYADKLKDVVIGNYYGKDGAEKPTSITDLCEKNLILFSKLAYSKEQMSGLYNDVNLDDLDLPYTFEGESGDRHFINHYLLEEDIVCIDGTLYHEFVLSTRRPDSDSIISRSDAFIIDNLIYAICDSCRCIIPIKGYELLVTPVASGIEYPDRGNNEDMIEFSIDDDIKVDLAKELIEKGYIADAMKQYGDRLKYCGMVRENIRFIERQTDEKEHGKVKDKYYDLLDHCLELLSDEKHALFVKARAAEAVKPRIYLNLLCHQGNEYSKFIVNPLNPVKKE